MAAANKAVEAPASGPTKKEAVTLYSPEGAEYQTSEPREITRLKARGYRTEKPKG